MEIDSEISAEIIESFNDLSGEIEIVVDRLSKSEASEDDLNNLFRGVHSIKGNAAMFQLSEIVNFTHSLEEVISAIRSGKIAASRMISDVIQLGMDRLKDLHHRDLLGYHFDNLQEEQLQELFLELSKADAAVPTQQCLQIFNVMGAGFVPESPKLEKHTPAEKQSVTLTDTEGQASFDLGFFRELAAQVDKQSQYWEGRSAQLHDWAQKVNAVNNLSVDPDQLSAATYLHDIGMSFIPNTTLEKKDKLTEDELKEIRQHTVWGYSYLIRIPGWDEAAKIILDHHERIDGQGYPNGSTGEKIHDGAKILAIIDAFFSITNGRADRSHRKSIVRAVSEINARVDTQFDREWVSAFNQMIKNELKSGAL